MSNYQGEIASRNIEFDRKPPTHLGHLLHNDMTDEADIQYKVHDFRRRANAILSDF